MFYQGGVFVVKKNDFGNTHWGIGGLEMMIDSQALKLPISRNDIIVDSGYRMICSHLLTEILPGIAGRLCGQLGLGQCWWNDLDSARAADIVIDYLCINPHFPPAQDLPLIPVLPFGLATVNQIRESRGRHGNILFCKCGGDEFDGVTGHKFVIDEKRLSGNMEKLLESGFGPVKRVDYQEDAMEAVPDSENGRLSQVEQRFQDALVLLSAGRDGMFTDLPESNSDRHGPEGLSKRGLGGFSQGGWRGSEYGPVHNPDIPDIRFKLSRLVRLDGKTPVSAVKFRVNGDTVILNLNHPEIKGHLDFAKKDPDLAAHWCLRELILSDRPECFRHLNYDACEALVLQDAVGRCVEVEPGVPRRRAGGKEGRNFWNDDSSDWERLFGNRQNPSD
jgi:hypothetical protein